LTNNAVFLSLTPNTEGFTVVATNKNFSSYAFEQNDGMLARLVIATKRVARVLDDYFETVGRTDMIFEGYGVDLFSPFNYEWCIYYLNSGSPIGRILEAA